MRLLTDFYIGDEGLQRAEEGHGSAFFRCLSAIEDLHVQIWYTRLGLPIPLPLTKTLSLFKLLNKKKILLLLQFRP